jgi:glycine cleavage system aminomethyltransferase T
MKIPVYTLEDGTVIDGVQIIEMQDARRRIIAKNVAEWRHKRHLREVRESEAAGRARFGNLAEVAGVAL